MFRSYTIEVAWLEGGPRAFQVLELVRSDGAAVIVGYANTDEATATLHTLGYTLAESKRTLGRELAIPPAEYMRFLSLARRIMDNLGILVRVLPYDSSVDECEVSCPSSGTFAMGELLALASCD